MEIKYFKTGLWGDCYVKDDDYFNIISISEDYLLIMADDEGIFEGVYTLMDFPENKWESLLELAKNGERRELTNVLKKIHLDNQKKMEKPQPKFFGLDDRVLNHEILIGSYLSKNPILN